MYFFQIRILVCNTFNYYSGPGKDLTITIFILVQLYIKKQFSSILLLNSKLNKL